MNNKIVISGAPGTGKTSIINVLLNLGYHCSKEISREIISQQLKIGGSSLPWKNISAFSKLVMESRKIQFANSKKSELHFFDRSIIDIIAYLNLAKINTPPELVELACKNRYNEKILYAPFWSKIFTNDPERRESIKNAISIDKKLKEVYEEYGYQIIEIPKTSINERVEFILSIV